MLVVFPSPAVQQPSSVPAAAESRRSESALFAASFGAGGCGSMSAFVDSKLDAALDYSWSLPLGKEERNELSAMRAGIGGLLCRLPALALIDY